MTHLPPFRTRQPAPPPSTEDETDFDDELPLLGEDAILERGALSSDPTAAATAPWDEPPTDDEPAWRPSAAEAGPPWESRADERRFQDQPIVDPRAASAPQAEDEAVAELLRDLNDVVPAATLAGAWATQYESSSRRASDEAAESAPPVLTDVLHESPIEQVREQPPVSSAAPWTPHEDTSPDHRAALASDEGIGPHRPEAQPDAAAPAAYAHAADDLDAADDVADDTGLSAADEILAGHIADSVMAALLPTLRDTVLDAVRDTLAARRHQG